jgi:CBS-domain-containing membrane protein
MFCGQLISADILIQGLHDPVGMVLHQMEDMKIRHLPVSDEEKFLGLIAEDDLDDEADDTPLDKLQDYFIKSFVKATDYFLVAVKLSHVMQLDLVPVLNEKNELEGVITRDTLFQELARMTGSAEYGSLVVLEMEKSDYSVGEINRLVESNDAVITQLNTWSDNSTHLMTVILRINKEEISDIVASFQRHEYNVRYYMGEELFRNELQSNLDHLMNYLNI